MPSTRDIRYDHDAVLEQLRRLEPAAREALVRRDQGYFATEARRPWILGWTATVSLGGLYVMDWSAASLWVFIFVGLWGGVIQNALKLALFKKATDRFYQGHANDAEVWAVVSVLRDQRDLGRVRVPEKGTTPATLLGIDLVFLSVATGMIHFIAEQRGIALLGEFAGNPQLVVLTALTLAAEVIAPLWQDRGHNGRGETTVKYDGAGPTIIGWVLMFLFAGLAVDSDGLRTLILVVNGLLIIAIPLAAVSHRVVREETRWLAERLDQLEASN